MSTVNITNLPLSDPRCNNETCLAYLAAEDASQAQISWASQFAYAKWVTYYYCGFLIIFALIYGFHLLTDRIHVYPLRKPRKQATLSQKFLAASRFLSYRRLPGKMGDRLGLPSLGISAFVLLSVLFALLLSFIQHPYYRGRVGYGSPPLAVRTGMAGLALTPITFALAGKYNLVTLLTGISHEKLNVLHRWVSYIYLFFGIAHTIPFIVADLRDGGTSQLHYQFYYAGSQSYSGIAPFVVLIFLCFFSIYWLRRKFYWLFAKSHILGSLAYLGTMFWHCDNSLDSWDYLWATLAIYIVQLTARAFGKTTIFEMTGKNGAWERAGEVQIEVLDDQMIELSIQVAMRWRPGQHVFIRIPELDMFANNPFTIASVCRPQISDDYERNDKYGGQLQELKFLIRPYGGMTKKLLNYNGSPPYAMIDGPYGGIARPLHLVYDNVILVGGGGGISALLPWLDDLSFRMSMLPESTRLRSLSCIWCIRDRSAITWVESELRKFARRVSTELQIQIYITGQETEATIAVERSNESEETLGQAKETSIADLGSYTLIQGRPFLPDALNILKGKTMIIGCGPESMKTDLSNFAARAQKEVLRGKCEEVALHTETFDW